MKPTTSLLFAPFEKVEAQDDGTVIVSGICSSEAVDHDGEIIKADAVRAALPDYMAFGAIREMHQAHAAGTAVSAEVDDAGVTHLTAHIVDASSVKKVTTGVLKGFSLGGRVTKRNSMKKNVIEGLRLTEISLVDRPANPDSVITMVKFDASGAVIDDTPRPKKKTVAQKKAAAELKKGLYDVSRLASIITDLNWLVECAECEAAQEEDGSTVPAQLKEACATLCGILKTMVTEETAELLGIDGDGDVMEAAAKAVDALVTDGQIRKLGAKFSSAARKAIGDVHNSLKDAVEKLNSLGYQSADNPEDQTMDPKNASAAGAGAPAAAGDDLTKVQGDLAKANEQIAALTTRAETAEADKAKAEALAKTATEQITAISEELVKKGIIVPVKKAADEKPAGSEVVAKTAADGKPDFNTELRSAFARPMSPIRGAGAR